MEAPIVRTRMRDSSPERYRDIEYRQLLTEFEK